MDITLPKGLEFPSYVDDLKEILEHVEPRFTLIPEMRRHISRFVDGADMDEVYPHIYLGDCDAAMNKQYLQRSGITHVLNAAANVKIGPAPVKTGQEFYKDTSIVYQGLDLIDLPFANVTKHFETAADFIDGALNSGGTVLVHCRQGRSRSASVLAAFFMTRRGYTAARAITQLKRCRDIRPNNGFLTQLAALDLQLFRERLERIRMEPSSSSESESESASEKKSPSDHDITKRQSSVDSNPSDSLASSVSIASSKPDEETPGTKDIVESPKSSDNESVEYHSAVSSVCSTSNSSAGAFENARSQSVSISVQLSLSRRRDQCTQYVSRCVRIQSDDSLGSDNDADDESSDNEG